MDIVLDYLHSNLLGFDSLVVLQLLFALAFLASYLLIRAKESAPKSNKLMQYCLLTFFGMKLILIIFIILFELSFFTSRTTLIMILRVSDLIMVTAIFYVIVFNESNPDKRSLNLFNWLIIIGFGILLYFTWLMHTPEANNAENFLVFIINLILILLLYSGIVMILVLRPKQWGIGFTVFVLWLVGEVAQVIYGLLPSTTHALVSLFQVISMPTFFFLNQPNDTFKIVRPAEKAPQRHKHINSSDYLREQYQSKVKRLSRHIRILKSAEQREHREKILLLEEIASMKQSQINPVDMEPKTSNQQKIVELEQELQAISKQLEGEGSKHENIKAQNQADFWISESASHSSQIVNFLVSNALQKLDEIDYSRENYPVNMEPENSELFFKQYSKLHYVKQQLFQAQKLLELQFGRFVKNYQLINSDELFDDVLSSLKYIMMLLGVSIRIKKIAVENQIYTDKKHFSDLLYAILEFCLSGCEAGSEVMIEFQSAEPFDKGKASLNFHTPFFKPELHHFKDNISLDNIDDFDLAPQIKLLLIDQLSKALDLTFLIFSDETSGTNLQLLLPMDIKNAHEK